MPSASPTASSSVATLVAAVHRVLEEPKASSYASLLEREALDCLSIDDARRLFQVAIDHASIELLCELVRQQLHCGREWDLTSVILRAIVDEGDAAMLEAFVTSDDVHLPIDDDQDAAARPLLHIAVEQDNAALVTSLLRVQGLVDVDEQELELGWAALHFAVEWDSVAMLTLLLDAGANINARAPDGVTPLVLAVQFGHVASVQFLVEAGADILIADTSGSTPLHTAAREGHTALIDYLLLHGASLECRDHEGRTPLHVAAFYDESAARFARGDNDTQVAVIRTLLAHGADATVRDGKGNTALLTAQRDRYDMIVDVLLAHTATSQ